MIDIHCNILPELDGIVPHEYASLKMARKAVEEGIIGVIATPHHNESGYNYSRSDIIQYVSTLNKTLDQEQISLQVFPAQVLRVSGNIVEEYEKGNILTENDGHQYLFIQLPSEHVPRYTSRLFYDIQMKGLTPIIVHPERNREFIESPGLLYRLVKDGALSQIAAPSIIGTFGKRIKRFSFDLLEHNLTHFVASDAHYTLRSGFRLKAAYDEIEHQFGTDMRYLMQDNAERVLQNQYVTKEIPFRIKKKKLLGWLNYQ